MDLRRRSPTRFGSRDMVAFDHGSLPRTTPNQPQSTSVCCIHDAWFANRHWLRRKTNHFTEQVLQLVKHAELGTFRERKRDRGSACYTGYVVKLNSFR